MKKIAYLFPGQGSQKVGMGRDLYESDESARDVFERANRALGFDLTRIMFEGPHEELTKTAYAQPAILTHSIAALKCLSQKGLPAADFVAGHSLGEYSALVACSTLSFEDAVKAVHFRGRVMQESVPVGVGAMAAVLGLEPEKIRELCSQISSEESENYVAVANFNGPAQTVISGTARGVEKASRSLEQMGARRVMSLPVSAPFHCALMKTAQNQLRSYLNEVNFLSATCPVVSNVMAQPVIEPSQIRDLLVEQVVKPVQFTGVVEMLRLEKIGIYIEFGPGKTLIGIMKRMIEGAQLLNVEDVSSLNHVASILGEE